MRHDETVVEERPRHLIDLQEILELLLALSLLRRLRTLGNRYPQFLCLQLDGLEIAHILYERQELEDIATCMTPEAIKKSLIGNDRERRRMFLMKRTAAPEPATLALERDILGDDGYNIRGLLDAFHELIHLCTAHCLPSVKVYIFTTKWKFPFSLDKNNSLIPMKFFLPAGRCRRATPPRVSCRL